jgi:hypothetical protein
MDQPVPALPVHIQVRYIDGNPVFLKKGEKFLSETVKEDWDGGSKGKVRREGTNTIQIKTFFDSSGNRPQKRELKRLIFTNAHINIANTNQTPHMFASRQKQHLPSVLLTKTQLVVLNPCAVMIV